MRSLPYAAWSDDRYAEWNRTVVVFKDVPAEVCDNCGEYYLSQDVTERIYQQAEEAVQRNAEVEVLRYAA